MTDADAEGEEAALIDRAKHGDRDAQDELCRLHMPGVLAWARLRLKRHRVVAERESSMDVVQTVFRQALADLGRFEYRGGNSFRNWLLTYTDNKLRNRQQYYDAERRTPDREVEASVSQFYGSIATPSQVVSAKEHMERFERAFAKLSENDQEIILMARIQALSHAEIGARMGISVDASKQALRRAQVRLASHMALDG